MRSPQGYNNTDENKKSGNKRAGKRNNNFSYSASEEHEVFILSVPEEHIGSQASGVPRKASTRMLQQQHNNNSHISWLHTGIPLAGAVSSLRCARVGTP